MGKATNNMMIKISLALKMQAVQYHMRKIIIIQQIFHLYL